MERLPVEILYKIGAHLDKNDQLNCTRVCRSWKNMMEKYILYRLVRIYSENSLHKLTRLVIKYPHIADRIEQLVFFFNHGAFHINISGLLSMLSNVREIIFFDISQVRVSVDSTESYPFHKRIQHIQSLKQAQ
jgi:hypothetical protein